MALTKLKTDLAQTAEVNLSTGEVYINGKLRNGTLTKQGYRVLSINSTRVSVHRAVAAASAGIKLERLLNQTELHVHHLNGVRDDNRAVNLQIMPARLHLSQTHFNKAHVSTVEKYLPQYIIPHRVVSRNKKTKTETEHFYFRVYSRRVAIGYKAVYFKTIQAALMFVFDGVNNDDLFGITLCPRTKDALLNDILDFRKSKDYDFWSRTDALETFFDFKAKVA